MSLLRVIGPQGRLSTYEIKEEAIAVSKRNIEAFLHHIYHQDIYQGINEHEADRVVLDVPEPWHVVPHTADVLVDGGLLVAYLPTVMQVHELVKALRAHPAMYTA